MNTISILAIFSVCAMMLLAEYSRRYEPEGSHGDTLGSWLFASQRRSGSSLEAAPVVRDAPSAKHSHPLWNPGDCALELLAWADPILDSPAALSIVRKTTGPRTGSGTKGAFVAPKGTWLWSIQFEHDLRGARLEAVKAGSEAVSADVAESKPDGETDHSAAEHGILPVAPRDAGATVKDDIRQDPCSAPQDNDCNL